MNTFRLSKFLFNHHLKNNLKPFSIASTIYSPNLNQEFNNSYEIKGNRNDDVQPQPTITTATTSLQDCQDNIDEKISETFFEKYVSHEFKIDKYDARKIYFLNDNLIQKYYPTNESLIELCKFLKLFFTSNEICRNPKPFLLPFQQLNYRTLMLKEIGFRSITIPMIEMTNEILKLNQNELRKYLNYPNEHNCFDSICKNLDIYGEMKINLRKEIENLIFQENNNNDNDDENINPSICIENLPINTLRLYCLAYYLSNTLKLSYNRSLFHCRKYSSLINELDLTTIKMNIMILQQNFSFNTNRILNNGLFLLCNPKNLLSISTKLSTIIDKHLYESLVQNHSDILKIDYEQIKNNYSLIKEKMNGQFYNHSIQLLSIDTKNLIEMFENIESNDDILKLNLKSLGKDFLVLNYQKILYRLDKLKQEEIPLQYIPLTFFIVDDDEFKLMLEDIKNDTELRIKFFIETYFNLNYEQIKHSLYSIANNVNTEKYSYNNANRIIEFLIAMNFDKNLIIKYSSLILFDYKSVKGAYFYLSNRINSSQRSSSPTSSSSMNVKQKNNEIFLQNLIQHLQQTKSATKILKNISFPNLMS